MREVDVESGRSKIHPGFAGTGAWSILQVLPRCEKKLGHWLSRNHLPHYLPTRRSVCEYATKRAEFTVPLFPGYVFAPISARDRVIVLRSNIVARIMQADNQEEFLSQLSVVRYAIDADVPMEVLPYLVPGARVRVHSGRWRGVEGVIQRIAGKTRLTVHVDLLQVSVALELDSGLVNAAC